MKKIYLRLLLLTLIILSQSGCSDNPENNNRTQGRQVTLLNVSYDPTREMYQEINKSFSLYWKKKTGVEVLIKQSHGGSGKQARSVIDGLQADVVTLALAYDIDAISEKSSVIQKLWQNNLPNNSSPYTSAVVFLVRKGNPKKIKDWDDLARSDVSVITPNPKTSGGARWNYLALWAYAENKLKGNISEIKKFVSRVMHNVPVFDSGARGSTNSFVQREMGDVLIAWENEALLVSRKVNPGEFEIIYPTLSILAEPPVAVVDKVVDKRGTRAVAEAYLKYLYSDTAQEIIARHFYRPVNAKVFEKYTATFPVLKMVTIKDNFKGWKNAHEKHFKDGATFDQTYSMSN